MSSVLPDTKLEQIQFCETHVPIWSLTPSAFGLTSQMCVSLTNATKAARDAYSANQTARAVAKGTTTSYTGKTGIMRDLAADMIRSIKTFAELQPDPSAVYGAADIPMPAAPTPLPAPGKPTNTQVTLESSGAITMSWDASNSTASNGGFFNISRKLPGQSGFSTLTGVPGSTTQSRRATFTDISVPTSAAGVGVQYIIQGRRGNLYGEPSDAVTVQFGVDGGGFSVTGATIVAPGVMKLAA